MRTDKPWTQSELDELVRLKTRVGFSLSRAGAALGRTKASACGAWCRYLRGRSRVVPRPPSKRRRGPRGPAYRSMQMSLDRGRAHPVVLSLLRAIVESGRSPDDVAERAGVTSNQFRDWGRGHGPLFYNLVAALQVVGLRLVVEEIEDETREG